MNSDDCRGIWASEDEFIRAQILEHLPEFLAWILDCCDPVMLRHGYEAGKIRVWSTPGLDGRRVVYETVLELPETTTAT